MPDALTDVGESAFANCTSLRDVKIGSSLKSLSRLCFDNCTSLGGISLPSTLNYIGQGCFKSCSGLTDVVIEDRTSQLEFSENDDDNSLLDHKAMFNDTQLKTVYIGGPIEYYRSPFESNQTLETVVISDRETEVQEKEFYACLNLRNVTIGNDVERIATSAFSACQSLEYFSFGTAMKTIEADAFSDCTSMTTLISKAKVPPTCGHQALDDINKWQCHLTVPYGCEQAYMGADQWKEFFFISVADEIKVSDIVLNFSEISLTEGEEVQLIAEIRPYDASDSSVIWTSGDAAVASVDSSGTVVALSAGRTTITVSAADGSGVYATCEVVVLPSSGVDGVTSDKMPVSVTYFTMSGVALPSLGDADGKPYIQVVKYADGTTVPPKINNRKVTSLIPVSGVFLPDTWPRIVYIWVALT